MINYKETLTPHGQSHGGRNDKALQTLKKTSMRVWPMPKNDKCSLNSVMEYVLRIGKKVVFATALQELIFPVLALNELDPVRNNLSLPQTGLSILTSLSAVAGAILKGELKAESSHKEVLLLSHALTNKETKIFSHEGEDLGKRYFSDSQQEAGKLLASPSVYSAMEDVRTGITDRLKSEKLAPESMLWRWALYLESKGYKGLKKWCEPSSFKLAYACILVEDGKATFCHKLILSWFWLNCAYRVRMVVGTHRQECGQCLEIPGDAWPGLLQFIPESWWPGIELGVDDRVILKCARHSGATSLLGQALLSSVMQYKDRQRLAIMLPWCADNSDLERKCLPKAYCALDAVERNMLPEIATLLLGQGDIPEEAVAGGMTWSAMRRVVALIMEIATAVLLSWAAQMPPLSASLVGRRLVRSYATGAQANSSLVATVGNQAHVCIESGRVALVDISTSVIGHKAFTVLACFEMLLVMGGVMAQYACWAIVLMGYLPPLFGVAPKARWVLVKACSVSALLTLCMCMCIFKNLGRSLNILIVANRLEFPQAILIFFWWVVSQVVIWVPFYLLAHHGRIQVTVLATSCAFFGEVMWLSAMSSGAHHGTMEDNVSWDRTASHVAPYLTDAGAALILAL